MKEPLPEVSKIIPVNKEEALKALSRNYYAWWPEVDHYRALMYEEIGLRDGKKVRFRDYHDPTIEYVVIDGDRSLLEEKLREVTGEMLLVQDGPEPGTWTIAASSPDRFGVLNKWMDDNGWILKDLSAMVYGRK